MKEYLTDQIGFLFDEAAGLFGEETLESMSMSMVSGGSGNQDTYENCGAGTNCKCTNHHCGQGTVCEKSGGSGSSGSGSSSGTNP